MISKSFVAAVFLVMPFLLTACPSRQDQPEPLTSTTPGTGSATAASMANVHANAMPSLSLLAPNGAQCEWIRLDLPAHQTRRIASFDGGCTGAGMAFPPDKTRALVWFDPELRSGSYSESDMTPPFVKTEPSKDATLRVYEVAVATGHVAALAQPPRGRISSFGYNTRNEAILLTEEEIPYSEESKPWLNFEGKQLPVPTGEGGPELVHAFRLTGKQWQRIETKASLVGADYSPRTSVLDAARDLSPNSTDILSPHSEGQIVKEPALLEKLNAYAPSLASREGQWLRLESSSVLVWQVSFEFVYSTGALLFDDGKTLTALPEIDFTDGDLTAPLVHGNYLLITQAALGAHPRLYDIKEKKLVYSSDSAVAVIFWPY